MTGIFLKITKPSIFVYMMILILSTPAFAINSKPPLPEKTINQLAGYFSSIAYNDENSQPFKEKLLKDGWNIQCDAFVKSGEEILDEISSMDPEQYAKAMNNKNSYSEELNNSLELLDGFISSGEKKQGEFYIQSLEEKITENNTANLDSIIPQHFGYAIGEKTLDNGKKLYVIAFRGTADTYSWILTDFLAFPVKFLKTKTHVHVGFEWNRQACMKRDILKNFVKKISNDKSDPVLIITGHSLGAAIAVLESAYIIENKLINKYNLYLTTLAEPCPGKKDFNDRYKNNIKNYKWFCNLLDPVPIAPMIAGYKHFSYLSLRMFNLGPKVPPIKNTFSRHSLEYYLENLDCQP